MPGQAVIIVESNKKMPQATVDLADRVYGITPLPTDPVQYTQIVEINQSLYVVDVLHGIIIHISVGVHPMLASPILTLKNGILPDWCTECECGRKQAEYQFI